MQFQQRLRDMCQKLTAAIPHAGLYIFTGPMDAPGYDADDLTLHCTLNNPSLFEHREEGLTSCDWLLEAVKGNVRRVGRSNL